MIIADTNVLSEWMRPTPSPTVEEWHHNQRGPLYITAITQAEILNGIELLPRGARRDGLLTAAEKMFEIDFVSRILPFDSGASIMFPLVSAGRRRIGRPISDFDAQIAAIVRAKGATLATRNIPDFEGCGIELVNPWSDR